MTTARRLLLLPVVVALVAACGGGAVAPSTSPSPVPTAPPSPAGPEPTPPPSGGPVDPTPVVPTPDPGTQAWWLRMGTTQALAPQYVFGMAPQLVITGDGLAVAPGAVPAVYPGPLVMPLFARQVSDAGRDQILAWAKELGLLSGKTDFHGEPGTIGGGAPGSQSGQITLTVDGQRITLTGPMGIVADNPAPGSAEAFGLLWQRLADLGTSLAAEVGPERPYTPAGYSILVGIAPAPDPALPQQPVDWPLEIGASSFGSPVAEGLRCGTITGDDAAAFTATLAKANALSPWVQDPQMSATFGLTVRALTPGEDACAETFGIGQ